MGDIIDLSTLLGDGEPTRDERLVDLSGKPKPVNVRVQLNSGVIVKCECRYHGINPTDGDRLYLVIAEIDWENYHPMVLIVEEAPSDVEYRFRVPGVPGEVCNQILARLQFVPERIVKV